MNVKYFNLQSHIGATLNTHVTTLSHNQLNLYRIKPPVCRKHLLPPGGLAPPEPTSALPMLVFDSQASIHVENIVAAILSF